MQHPLTTGTLRRVGKIRWRTEEGREEVNNAI
jgi:hypothetical protein